MSGFSGTRVLFIGRLDESVHAHNALRCRALERLGCAVATLDPVTFTPEAETADELATEDRTVRSFTALNRWLLRIPVARRVESLWDYEIAR